MSRRDYLPILATEFIPGAGRSHVPERLPGIHSGGKHRSFLLLAAVVALACAFGCGHAIQHKIEGGIETVLPKVIGPADSYDVKVNASNDQILNGEIPEVVMHGKQVNISSTTRLDAMDVDCRDIVFDPMARRIKSMGSLDFDAAMGQQNIDRYMQESAPENPGRPDGLRIVLRDSDLQAKFLVKVAGVNVPVMVQGDFARNSAGPALANFIPTRGAVSIVPIPEKLLKFALAQVNPVVDLSGMAIPVRIKNIGVSHHQIFIAASAIAPINLVTPSSENKSGG